MRTSFPGDTQTSANTRSLLAVGVGKRASVLYRSGDWARFDLFLGDFLVWQSAEVPVKELLRNYAIPSIPGGKYRLYLVVTRYFGKAHNAVFDKHRYRFDFIYPRKRGGKFPPGNSGLILVKGHGSQDLPTPLLKMRKRLNSAKPRTPRRPKSPKSISARPNPEVWYSSKARWNIADGSAANLLPYTFISRTRSWSGTTTPGFRDKRRKRIRLPINSYGMTLTEWTDGGYVYDTWTSNGLGSVQTQGGAYQERLGTASFGSAPIDPGFDNSADFKAIRKLIERVGPSNNIAQDFVQMGQTVSMIADTAKRIAAAIHDTRRGNFSGAANALFGSSPHRYRKGKTPSKTSALADNWLAFQYGWKPLLQDIDGAMDSLARLNLSQTQTFEARASASSKASGRVRCYQNVGGGATTGFQSYDGKSTVRYGLRYKIDDHLTTFLAQTGFTNPINLAWELLPYSFVVDWFIPIGGYLEAISAWDGLQFVDGWKASTLEVINIWDVGYSGKTYPTDAGDVQMEQMFGACRHRKVVYDRIPLTGFPRPNFPSFKNPLSVTHALNALALMKRAF